MTDERPAAQEAIWQQLRTVEPPAGAKTRVRSQIEAQIGRQIEGQIDARRARKPRWPWLAAPAVAALVIAFVIAMRGPSVGPTVVAASSAEQGDRALVAGEQLGEGTITVRGSLRVALDRAAVEVVGPATVAMSREQVVLFDGKVEIAGTASVRGPTCTAHVDGKSTIELRKTQLVVAVFAGSAEIVPPHVDCQVFDLSPTKIASAPNNTKVDSSVASPDPNAAPNVRDSADPHANAHDSEVGPNADPNVASPDSNGTPDPNAPNPKLGTKATVDKTPDTKVTTPPTRQPLPSVIAPDVTTPTRQPAPSVTAPMQQPDTKVAPNVTTPNIAQAPARQPSELAAQTDAYWAAHALRERDPAGALAKLRELVQKWPRAAIRHEVDLAIIDALVRLRRTDEARVAAKQFLRDYPKSARAKDMRAIADAP